MFSARLPPTLTANALARAVAGRRSAGRRILDLTETNPTAVGLPYPPDLLQVLGDPAGIRYRPDPRGLADARGAVADSYGPDAAIDPDAVVLTASTSEAYASLFKLLCDPGDEILVPRPSYPLFDLLSRLDAVAARPYDLDPHAGWAIDRASVERASGGRARALLLVSPNNPTGSWLRRGDRDWLVAHCRSEGMALISDEVFADYPLSPRHDACSLAGDAGVLTFTLGGLSKSAGLPQVKLGWVVTGGPAGEVAEAIARLELIADTYLSVSTPVQLAARQLMAAGAAIRRAIRDRIRGNLDMLRAAAGRHPAVTLTEPEGGWSAVLRVPSTASEEALVLRALEDADVLVHPGYFFDFPGEAYLVLSLLPEPSVFADAVGRLLPLAAGATS